MLAVCLGDSPLASCFHVCLWHWRLKSGLCALMGEHATPIELHPSSVSLLSPLSVFSCFDSLRSEHLLGLKLILKNLQASNAGAAHPCVFC